MDHPDDAELLRCYADDRSEAAFAELVRRHLNLVYRSALRQTRGDSHRAEDVAQAVFTELARKAGRLIHHPRLAGWLHTTTHHVTSALLRGERRRQLRETEAQMLQDPLTHSGDGWDRVGPVLDEVMRGLGQVDREAILLHFLEGRPFAEVGARLALGEDAARMRVTRALERLRGALARRGVRSTAAALGLMLTHDSAIAAPANLFSSTVGLAAASAGTSAGPAIGVLLLMSTSKLAVGVTVFATLLALGTDVHYLREIRSADAAVLAWNQRTAEAEGRLRTVQSQLKAAEARSAAAPAEKAAAPPGGAAAGSAAGPTTDEVANALALQRWRDLGNAAGFELAYGPYLRSIGVTPEQVQQLQDAILRATAKLDDRVVEDRLSGGDQAPDPVLLALTQSAQSQVMAEAATIIGPANLQAFKEHLDSLNSTAAANANGQQMGEARYLATQVAGLVYDTASPLTADQRAQVVQLIASNTPRKSDDDYNREDVNWDGVVAQAGMVLPPAQVAAIKSLQASVARGILENQVRQAAAGKAGP